MLNSVIPSWMKYGQDEEKKDNNDNNNNDEVEPVFVANIAEFSNTDRKTVHVPEMDANGQQKERPIILIKANNTFYALDLRCYHAGGPLSMGDIEDVEGNLCIKCPWHRYIIKLDTGEVNTIFYEFIH